MVDQVVAEISSFQLEWITTFCPQVAALLNLSEDHLDRYASYQEYINAKLRIFENQGESDFAVVNRDDELVWRYAQGLKAQLFPFSRKQELEEGIYHRDGVIVYRHNGREECFPTKTIRLEGVHNLRTSWPPWLARCSPDAARTTASKPSKGLELCTTAWSSLPK